MPYQEPTPLIIRLREEVGLSCAAVAREMGVSPQLLRARELGRRPLTHAMEIRILGAIRRLIVKQAPTHQTISASELLKKRL